MRTRREAVVSLITASAATALSSGRVFAAANQTERKRLTPAILSRPPSGPATPPFTPAGEYLTKPGDFDYVQEEWFASGTDDQGHPYTTLVAIRRPRDPKRFSGTVIVEPLHVGRIAPIFMYGSPYILRSGHGWACVVSQKTALDVHVKPSANDHYAALQIYTDPTPPGAPANLTQSPVGRLGPIEAEAWWAELDRFNQASDAILAQVGAALTDRAGPFAGYPLRRRLLVGHSQTGGVTSNFIKRAHTSHRLADGAPVYHGFMPSGFPLAQFGPRDVPLIQLLSDGDIFDGEFSARPGFEHRAYRRADSDAPGDRYRLYELAGAPHMGTRYPPHNNPRNWPQLFPGDPKSSGAYAPVSGDVPLSGLVMNSLPHHELFTMTLDHLVLWADKGKVPPRAARIELEPGGRYCAKDQYGNTRGGVRCAQMDVPHSTYYGNPLGPDGKPQWAAVGSEAPFDKARMAQLYGSPANYVAKFNARLDELVRQGWMLADDAEKVRPEAKEQAW